MQILKTFNYDELLIKEYKHWYLLLRSNQTTIGSMVLIEKNFHTKFSDITSESFAEFGKIIKEIELTLKTLFRYDKINYLMLMMRDKEVHFHVIPRYSKEVTYKSITFRLEKSGVLMVLIVGHMPDFLMLRQQYAMN